MVSMSPSLMVAIGNKTPHPEKARLADVFTTLGIPIEPNDFANPKELNDILSLDKKELAYRGAYLRVMAMALAMEGKIIAYHIWDKDQGDQSDLAFVCKKLWDSWVAQDPKLDARRERFNLTAKPE